MVSYHLSPRGQLCAPYLTKLYLTNGKLPPLSTCLIVRTLPYKIVPFQWQDTASLHLACKDANSKLVEVVTVADVDAEDRAGNSLLKILELRFGHKSKFLFIF